MTAQAMRRKREGQHRRGEEDAAIGAARDHRLLDEQLQPVGDRLQQPERADDVGALAQLRRGQDLALGIGQIGDRHQQRHDDRERLADVGSRLGRPYAVQSQPCVPVFLALAPADRRGAGRHGRRRAADRVGAVEIGDRDRRRPRDRPRPVLAEGAPRRAQQRYSTRGEDGIDLRPGAAAAAASVS